MNKISTNSVNTQKLERLFYECLSAEYTTVENAASFSVKRVNNSVTVFFEHSRGRVDWKNNFRFSTRPYKNMGESWKCHKGFLSVFKAALPYLEEVFSDKSVKKFTLVGYSHGAALAFLAYEYIWYNRPELRYNLEGYGYGCPRVFAGRLTPSLAKRWQGFLAVKNFDDIVTHLPPRILGYKTVSSELIIGQRGRYTAIDAHRPESYKTELYLLNNKGSVFSEEVERDDARGCCCCYNQARE